MKATTHLDSSELVALECVTPSGTFFIHIKRQPRLHSTVPRDSGKATIRVVRSSPIPLWRRSATSQQMLCNTLSRS